MTGSDGAELTRRKERERLLRNYGPNGFEALAVLFDRQFRSIHNRAELLLGICGVLVSASVLIATGRSLAAPGDDKPPLWGYLVVAAGALDLAAAAVVVAVVMGTRWITQQPGDDVSQWIDTNLRYRDSRTRAHRVAIGLVLLSMLLYQSAVSVSVLRS